MCQSYARFQLTAEKGRNIIEIILSDSLWVYLTDSCRGLRSQVDL